MRKPNFKVGDRVRLHIGSPSQGYQGIGFDFKFYEKGNVVREVFKDKKRWYACLRGCGWFWFPAGKLRRVP